MPDSKTHARWSPSASSRYWKCKGSFTLIERIAPPDKTTPAAEYGTALHDLAYQCLTMGRNPEDYLGTKLPNGQTLVEGDAFDRMKRYVGYIRERQGIRMYETKVDLRNRALPIECSGTVDAIVYDETDKYLEIVDLKTGRMPVDPVNNTQLMTYAVGALSLFPNRKIESICLTIVQDDIISSVIPTDALYFWLDELRETMRECVRAETELSAIVNSGEDHDAKKLKVKAWAEKNLAYGDQCRYCRAAAFCPKLEAEIASVEGMFTPEDGVFTSTADVNEAAKALFADSLSDALSKIPILRHWINAITSRAEAEIGEGRIVRGWKLVPKRSLEKWRDEEKTTNLLIANNVPPEHWRNFKLRTPKQVRAALKKAKIQLDFTGMSAYETSSGFNLKRDDGVEVGGYSSSEE